MGFTNSYFQKKNKLLRNSNNDLNVELKGMSIMKNEIEEKNQEIERLRATIVEKGKQQESTWATGSLFLQIRYKFIPYI